jgi:chitodextrinase
MKIRRLMLACLAAVLGALALTAAPALAAAPVVLSESVSGVKATEARLEALVNPNSEVTECHFQYGVASVAEHEVQCEAPVIEGEEQGVGVTVAGLVQHTGYHYRVVLKNLIAQEATGVEEPFETALPPEKPETTSPAKSITATTATLEGVLNPIKAGEKGTYEFLYRVSATECAGERASPSEPEPLGVMSGAAKQGVVVPVTSLQPNATYTFCLLARNKAGETSVGSPVNFTTPPAPPTILSEGVSSIKAGEAHLEGTVNPNNETSECKFEYGTDPSLATGTTTTLCEPSSFPAEYGGQGVGLSVGGLEADKTYYYRILASNATGTETGTIEHFTTDFLPETPEATAPNPSTVTATGATFLGVLNPLSDHSSESPPGGVAFHYRQSATECQGENEQTVSPETQPAGGKGEDVKAQVTGLLPGAQYTYCLIATNNAGEASPPSAPVTFTTRAAAPAIVSESFSDVQETAVILNAQIDPNGAETAYRFEYGVTASYGESTPVSKLEGPLTAADAAAAGVTGLQPGTNYHYRVLATSSQSPGGIPGPDHTFTTPASPHGGGCPNEQVRAGQPKGVGLPDCRAYEQVTPVVKNGLNALGAPGGVHVSPSGDAVSFFSTGGMPGAVGAPGANQRYVARRGAGGWFIRGMAPPSGDKKLGNPEVFGAFPDSSKVFTETIDPQPAPGGPPGQFNIFEQDTATGAYQFFAPDPTQALLSIAAVTPDDSHFIFEDEEQLLPAATPGRENLYESSDGQISLVGVLPGPNGKAPARGSRAGGRGAALGEYTQPDHALSDDGSRVFFTDPGTNNLYVRENAGTAAASTVLVAEAARFQMANADGSLVFFTKGEEHNEGLFAYSTETGQTSELAAKMDANRGAVFARGGVLGTGGSGTNDTYLYFATESVLAGDAVEGQPNIYVDHYDGVAWTIGYVATVSFEGGREDKRGDDLLNWALEPAPGNQDRVSRVTPDGRTLLFTAAAQVTSYDNNHYFELYLYEAENKRITCVSCSPAGEPATASALLSEDQGAGSLNALAAPRNINPQVLPHSLSDSGARVFFGTTQSLVAQDTNGVADVYEWEKDGSGSCVQVGGCLSLISNGSGAEAAYLGDASANGNDVFFFTHQPLVAQDEDQLQDIYDARVGAGVVPVAAPACSGTGCQGLPPAPPIFATPSSVTFNGVGNFAPAPKAKAKPKAKNKPRKHKHKARRKKGKKSANRHKQATNSAGRLGRGGR